MDTGNQSYEPIQGKTYSLFGNSQSTQYYYQKISDLADQVLEQCGDADNLIGCLREAGRRIHSPGHTISFIHTDQKTRALQEIVNEALHEFTQNTPSHLATLPITKCRDRRLLTTRTQYHLYMLEIEISNRINKLQFDNTDVKIALLPHCLRDFTVKCKARPDDFDYQCRKCSARCYENRLNSFLSTYQIEPYIWMGSSLAKKARALKKEGKTLGILGIACIPELTWGIHKCRKMQVPVLGLPLDANRCSRWMGDFYSNSVNFNELEKLIRIRS